jgi:hypothetical protein
MRDLQQQYLCTPFNNYLLIAWELYTLLCFWGRELYPCLEMFPSESDPFFDPLQCSVSAFDQL